MNKVVDGGIFGIYETSVKKVSQNIHFQALCTRFQHNWSLLMAFPLEFIWSPLWLVYRFYWKRFIKK